MGYLLNNGVVGVYFNDNTKIILSSDGNIFQYYERKKRNNTSYNNNSIIIIGENICMTHNINKIPSELTKKSDTS